MYQHILLVTDLKEDANIVAQKAKLILDTQKNAKLSALHIVESSMVGVGYEYMSLSVFDEIDKEHAKVAENNLRQLLENNHLTTDHTEVSLAMSGALGIINYCNEHDVDMLVIGRHERHGLSAIFSGATVDGILSKVHCDVLVVHLDKPIH